MEYKRYVQRNNLYLDFPESGDEEVFMIVFDVSSLEEEELVMEFLEENKLKVSLKHGFRDSGKLSFSRDCTYVYSIPENVQSTNLVAYWSGDNFLVIKEENTGAIKSVKDPNEQKTKLDETLNSSVTTNDNEDEMEQEIIPSNELRENEENIIKEKKSTSLASGQEVANQTEKSIKAPCESEEKIEHEKVSTSVLSESGGNILQEVESTIVSNDSKEEMVQKKKATDVSSEGGDTIMQEKNSPNGSNVNTEKPKQRVKSIDASDTVQAKPRLYPKRVNNLLNHMLSISDLQAVMNDIEKRMKFVNEFMDKHRFESI